MRVCKFPENLKALRMRAGLTRNKLANEVGISKNSITDWEYEKRWPNVLFIMTLANYFNITVDELLYGDIENDIQRSNKGNSPEGK